MNDHLIKNHRNSSIKSGIVSLVSFFVILYLTGEYDSNYSSAFSWILGFVYIVFAGFVVKTQITTKVLLEIKRNAENFEVVNYSILKGKNKLILNPQNIIEIEGQDDLRICYSDQGEENWIVLEINAEPWNNLFDGIRALKMVEQKKQLEIKE